MAILPAQCVIFLKILYRSILRMMKQYAMTLDLKDDEGAVAAYRRYHQAVWPEVLEALQAVGVHDMRIWLWGRRMFMLLEVTEHFDPDRDFARYLTLHPRCEAWEALMGEYQQPLPGTAPGEKWVQMEAIFHLQAQVHGSDSSLSGSGGV